MVSKERAIITIYGMLGNRRLGRYLAVAELADRGYTRVELKLLNGVDEFPSLPYMVTVACDDVYAELREHDQIPLLIINEWQPMNHFYM